MDLKDKFIIARWAYSIGKDFISDIEYDRIEQTLKEQGLLPEYMNRGWSEDDCPYDLLKKYSLEEFIIPVIHTFKTESIPSLNSEQKVLNVCGQLNQPSRLSMKCDGFSGRLNYFDGRFVNAMSRNRGEAVAKELMSIAQLFPQRIALKGKVMVAVEIYLKNSTWETYKQVRNVVSQRNAVSSAIANGDWEYLGFKAFNIYSDNPEVQMSDKYLTLQKLGFITPQNVMVRDYQTLLSGIKLLGKFRKSYNAPTDGVVLENQSMQWAIRIGEWEEQQSYSYVTGYKFNRGMYNDAVLCSIKPVTYTGRTQVEIAVTNLQTVIDYNLRVGSPIAFVERSGVNFVFDSIGTEHLQSLWEGRYEEFRAHVNELSSQSN